MGGPLRSFAVLADILRIAFSLASRCMIISNLSRSATLTATVILSPVLLASSLASLEVSGFLMFSLFAGFLIFRAMTASNASYFFDALVGPHQRPNSSRGGHW